MSTFPLRQDQVEGLDASKIVSGVFDDARISQSSVTQHEAAINHDVLLNFVANEHIDHTSVTLTAGEGLTGGGDIAASRSFALDFSDLSTTDTVVTNTDLISIHDGAQKKITFTNFQSSIDHGSISGLVDDDHTQYALLAGRVGGQTLNGGTASGNRLTLISTSNATKGSIVFGVAGTTAYDEATDRLGIGTGSPGYPLDIVGDARIRSGLIIGGTNSAAAPPDGQIQFDSQNSSFAGLAFLAQESGSYTSRTALLFDTTNNASFPFLTNRTPSGAVVVKTGTAAGGAENEHFRINGGDGTVNAYFTNANVGIGTSSPSAKLNLNQASTTAAIPVLTMTQSDDSEDFIAFKASVGLGTPIQTAAIGTYYGKARVSVNGTFKYIALYNS